MSILPFSYIDGSGYLAIATEGHVTRDSDSEVPLYGATWFGPFQKKRNRPE